MRHEILVVLIFFGGGKSNAYEDFSFNNQIRQIMSQYDAVGVSIVLVKNDRICFWQSFGYAYSGNV